MRSLQYRLEVNTLHRDEVAGELKLNDIGRIHLRTTVPLFYDEYRLQQGDRQLRSRGRADQRDRRRRHAPSPGKLTPPRAMQGGAV